jgi:RNA polymerase sigma-70 factor (ECF subfamily)
VELAEQIESLRRKGNLRGAATKTVEGYGAEVFGFLVTLLRDEGDAAEVFSQTCEDLWVGLARFEGRCSMRTWLYTLARHAAARLRRAPHRRPGCRVALSELSDVAERVRSETLSHLRSSVKDRFAAIRDALGVDERALLVLRVDRGMSWREIANVFSPEDTTPETLRRVETKLRKRFQVVKNEIRARAREAGVLRDHEP